MALERPSDALAVSQPAEATARLVDRRHELGYRDLTCFALISIVAARWVPMAAHGGPGAVTLWILSAIFFVAPMADATAALVARDPQAGGLYLWTRRDFGPGHGFLCGFMYWIGIAVLFPTAGMMYAQVGLSMFDAGGPPTTASRVETLALCLAIIWGALIANLVGLRIGKWAENAGALATMAIGVVMVAVAWIVWNRHGAATALNFTPPMQWGTLSFWALIAYGSSGMEGPGAMAAHIAHPPGPTMRKAGWTAAVLALCFYAGTTVAFLVILPPGEISILNGFAEVTGAASAVLGTRWLSPLIAILVLIGGVGFIGSFGASASQLPLAAAADGLLSPRLAELHPRWQTPHRAILALGVVSTVIVLAYQLGDSARAALDELLALMVITGFIPYLYFFGSAWKTGRRLSAISGGAVTIIAIACAMIPPEGDTNLWLFEGKLIGGTLLVAAGAWAAYRWPRAT